MIDRETEVVIVRFYFFLAGFFGIISLDLRWLFAFHHPIFAEEYERVLSVLIHIEGIAFLHIVLPIAFILRSVGVVKHSEAISHSRLPISFIAIPQVLSFPFGL